MNKQITEDFVSFEIAKLLKEKGFDERGLCVYTVEEERFYTFGDWVENSCLLPNLISAPTHQMALKWLREVYDLHIIVYPWQADNEEKAIHWCCTVYKAFAHLGNDVYTNETPKSYEQAVEAALDYVLKNLI